jgi:putative PIN family toxin of toxin-antitoxin system
MLKVVFDTNIIISAFNFGGKPAEVVKLGVDRKIKNIISEFILSEARNVLLSKFLWTQEEAEAAISTIMKFSETVNPPKESIDIISACPPDNRILECAVEGGADYIISGDRHLKDLQEFQGIKIVDPATFLAAIKNQTK